MTHSDISPVRLQASDLTVTYGDHQVLRGLSLQVRAGEIYALLGGNGAGKSTALSTFLGFVQPTSGWVKVCGLDPAADADTARRQMAYLPENVALYEHLTARENVDYLLGLSGERRSADDVAAAFTAAGLQDAAWNKRLGGFSKGMRQKVAIAIALLRRVPVLLLDEPTSGLDPKAAADFNRLISDLRDQGTAILMVTHDVFGAVDIADRIGFLEAGRIVREAAASGPERYDLRALHHHFSPTVAA